MIPPVVWAAACIVVGVALIAVTCFTVPELRRRRRTDVVEPTPVEGLPDDFPTAPIPRVPASPVPTRQMLRRDELLWHKGAVDDEGAITLGLLPEAGGQVGVLMDVDGEAVGVRLDRHEAQGLRHALTLHLADTAKPVRS